MSGEVASTVSTAAFSSVCSESMIPDTQHREAAAAAQRELVVGGGLLHALGARAGECRVGLVDGDRAGQRRVDAVV